MLEVKDLGNVLLIITYCQRIEEKTKSNSKEIFYTSQDLQEIISFKILQIGETAKNLSDEFTKENNLVPWKKIKGMRDRIVHSYGTIELEIVWATACEDIPTLRKYLECILDENNNFSNI